ncbi:MAG: hypothetical protein ACXQTS_00850 [Candidatus Methanospirareceae archaeon]
MDIKPATPKPKVETPERVEITGAAFTLPETLKDDVSSYKDGAKAMLEKQGIL